MKLTLRRLAIAFPLLALAALTLRLNTTPSAPLGLYLAIPDHSPPRGALVIACAPPNIAPLARNRGYLPAGIRCPSRTQPLLKRVIAVPNDTVQLNTDGITVNGVPVPFSAPLLADPSGRPLRPLFGSHQLTTGEYWLFLPTPGSFDSRYFGAVRPTARAYPLVTP